MRAMSITAAVMVSLCAPAAALEAELRIHIEQLPRPVVSGTTNLPDGTELLVTVERADIGYKAQAKTSVQGGRYKAGPFSHRDHNLPPGGYTVEVLMPIPPVQPASVRAVIGDAGQHLTGNLVSPGPLGHYVVVKASVAFAFSPGKK